MKRTIASLALISVVMLVPGCAQLQEGVSWVFFPNETAVRQEWEAEQQKLDADRKELTDAFQAAAAEERERLGELAMRRVELDRDFEKAKIDYNANHASLDVEEAGIASVAREKLEAIEAKMTLVSESFDAKKASFEQRLEQAQGLDNMLSLLAVSGLSLLGGGGIAGGAVLRRTRNRVKEAREDGKIREEEAFNVLWDSLEGAKEEFPAFKKAWDENPEALEFAKNFLRTMGDQYAFMAEKKKSEKVKPTAVVPKAGG